MGATETALWACRAAFDSADQPTTAGSFTDEQGTVGLDGGSKALRFARSDRSQSATEAALLGIHAAVALLSGPEGRPAQAGGPLGRWVGGWVGGWLHGLLWARAALTMLLCPRSMKLNGCSESKGKKESEMAAALTGPCSAAAVARQSCNRMASKRGEGVPR